ncbi:M20/M25/M40 family metallo-hydrolase [Pseudogracilibacillus sp. SO30301A]|uniref:M20/M25/M40 family metallo-hydrolase n=1 Tax=Pseudogracilibacillus sp. SO30301A TaxID=3098291 RepID=UPI00300E041C
MGNTKWSNSEQLRALLCELVSCDSRTGTQGEINFAHKLKEKLLELDYFQTNSSHINLHDAERERNAVTAFYNSEVTDETIVLISHFDTVHTEEYGDLGDLAFQPERLTKILKNRMELLTEDAQVDLKSNEYLFGRGTMDMKMGLALHMHLLEKASNENWPINLLLVTVPDEEVNSAGMREEVKGLTELRERYNLHYKLFLNSEPSFSQTPRDENYYIYSGTIGKIMPSALFYGRETHAGEPLNGLTSHYMASYLTQAMEFNEEFVEEVYGEETPLPICLQVNDLKLDYSTQTSHHSYALYNVFMMERNAREIMDIFKATAERAMKNCQYDYLGICKRKGMEPIGEIKVLEYGQLLTYAEEKFGADAVQELIKLVTTDESLDDREMSIQITDTLMLHCSELAPATVLFFAPPYYPAVNSSENRK